MPVTIAAVHIAFFVNLQPHLRMAQSGRNIAAAVASNAGFTDTDGFGLIDHAGALAKRESRCNGLGLEVVERNRPSASIFAPRLITANF